LLEPLLGPIRRGLPLLGGVDLSPVVLMVATQVLQMLLL
jgi:YggT family protein